MKILVVGCGSIGVRHARNASRHADTAVVDAVPEVASACADGLAIKAFPDLETGFGWKPDGVIIATPTNTHVSVASKAIETGADVLIEKPISHNLDRVDRLLDAADESGRKVFVVSNMRFHPAVALLHEHLEGVGRPMFARAHVGNYLPNMRPGKDYRTLYCSSRLKGGGVVLDAIHEIDYLAWLLAPVVDVRAITERLGDLEIDVEDYACICLKHAGGVLSEIHMDYLRPFKRRGCEIVGTEGMLLWQSEGQKPEKCRVRLFRKSVGEWETVLSTDDLDTNEPYEILIQHFLGGINGGRVPLLTGRDAVKALSVALRAAGSGGFSTCEYNSEKNHEIRGSFAF